MHAPTYNFFFLNCVIIIRMAYIPVHGEHMDRFMSPDRVTAGVS